MPHGYHGPSMAAPGYDLYYLNVMAGPGERAWRFTDDPAHAWIRATLGRPRARSTTALREATHETDGRPSPGPLPHGPVQRARRRRAAADRRLLRDLRPRQRRRRRPGAGRAARRRCPSTTPATSRRWCTPRPPTRARRTGCRRSPAPAASARARPTWSPAPPSRRSTACPSCCCPATSSPPAAPAPSCRSSRTRRRPRATVNDTLRPVSKFWTRVERPEQLTPALLAAMRVLTDPAETGAVTLALPQDVQAEAFDWPEELFEKRVWRVRRPLPEPEVLERAAELLRDARRPLIVSGGGTIYAEATDALREFAERPGSASASPRPARARCPTTTRRRSARSAPPAPPPPTPRPARPT